MREPNIWKNKDNFYLKVLEEPWYGLLVKLENLITFETMKFYEKKRYYNNSFTYNYRNNF